MRVLIIDDDPILIMVCSRLMNITDFSKTVVSSRDGKEGFDYLKSALETAPETLPDLILLDINMPVMNGWDFLDLYAELEAGLPKSICIVMLSSTVDQADYDRANSYSQVSGFYSKPLTKENLPDIAALVQKGC